MKIGDFIVRDDAMSMSSVKLTGPGDWANNRHRALGDAHGGDVMWGSQCPYTIQTC